MFARAKDLLLFINPILGVVIGYYFNKASTEGRAEQAEENTRAAQAQMRRATTEAARAQAALGAVRAAAEDLAKQGDPRLQTQLRSFLQSIEK
jgi:hypothetical protein